MEEKFFVEGAADFIPPVNDSPYKRILVFGDVHGQLRRLKELWEKISVTDEDLVIFLGDYILSEDGDDFGTLHWLAEKSRQENVITLMGNTDYEFTELVEENDNFEVSQDSLNFLRSLPLSYSTVVGGKKYFFCHAGVNPDKPLEAQRKYQLTGLNSYEKFYQEYSGEAVIVVGHKSPKKIVEKIPRIAECVRADFDLQKPLKIPCANILMLDTRAKDATGYLSCVDILSGQYWQSSNISGEILFVCSGNTCRSPMAKYIMRHLLDAAGLADKISVDSAGCNFNGTGGFSIEARRELMKKNIPFDLHVPKKFTKELYRNFKVVIALDADVFKHSKKISDGDPAEKIRMLKDFGGKKINVDDPWCSGDYAKAYEEIFIGCSELLKELSTK